MRIPVRAIRSLFAIACGTAALNACVLLFGGAALGGAVIATDRRSTGIQLEDANIEHRVNSALSDRFARESVRIDVTSYNQKVLLAGKVPTERDRSDAEAIARATLNVRQVIDELSIGSLAGLSGSGDDELLATKVKASLLDVKGLSTGAVKTSCTDGTIYLFGLVSPSEADIAKRVASRVSGVRRVVAVFDLIAESEVERIRHPDDAAPATADHAQ
jgi:osmotically-inducible protein OsmY